MSTLSAADIDALTAFRRALHKRPELSGEERETAATLSEALSALAPDALYTSLGGHGVAAVFDSGQPGPTMMFRAELDALPIQEIATHAWRSEIDGKAHLCGHDGHMTILLALGQQIARQKTARGRVVLLYQPAEENGSGARAVVADTRFQAIDPDWCFALHNMPGLPVGHVSTASGLLSCASVGLRAQLTGRTSHAAEPHNGISPAGAIATLIPALTELNRDGALDEHFQLVTLTHVQLGDYGFGISPGEAEMLLTLRTTRDETLDALRQTVQTRIADEAARHGLGTAFSTVDHFTATFNHPEANALAENALDALSIPRSSDGMPMRPSEDFGVFGKHAKAAMVFVGAGESVPALHNPDYDFDDRLIPIGAALFERIAHDLLG